MVDHIQAYLTRPDIMARNEPWQIAGDKALRAFIELRGQAAFVVQSVVDPPPSRGYEPLLIASGWNYIAACGMAKLAVRHGRRRAKEAKWYRPVFDAIRFLAQRPRQARAIVPRAKFILEAWETTSIVETIFDEAGVGETEFIRLLQCVVEQRQFDGPRIMQIAALVAPHLLLPRGPKISAPSAAHDFLLQFEFRNLAMRQPGTQRRAAEYIDALTRATRREFDVPDFDSRPAHRRQKARHGTNAA